MGRRNMNVFVIISLLSIFHVKDSLAQEETQCAGVDVKLNEHQKAHIAECLDQAGIKSIWKIPAAKLSCFGVCVIEKAEMMTPEGTINHEKAFKYIEAVMPDSVQKPLIDGVDKCIKEHGNKIKSDNDPNCLTFLDVGQCVHDVFIAICF